MIFISDKTSPLYDWSLPVGITAQSCITTSVYAIYEYKVGSILLNLRVADVLLNAERGARVVNLTGF